MQNLTSLTQSSAGNITCSKNFTVTGTTTMNGTVDLTGATVTGLTATASAVSPDADDGAALGTTSLKWSDLFLASGAVVNFNSGDVTLTHSENLLTIAGGNLTAPIVTVSTGLSPDADDGAYLGAAGTAFSDLFLAEGGVINWDSGDVTITQTGNVLAIAGGKVTFDTAPEPSATDGAALGSGTVMWSDLFLASGGVINFNNGDVTLTHSSNALAIAGGAVSMDNLLTLSGNTGITLTGSAVTKGINFASATVAMTDADNCLISYGTWNDEVDIGEQSAHFVPIQVHMHSTTSAAYDIAAARFRVDTDGANTANAVGCLQLRQQIGDNVASSAILNASVNVSAAVAVQTGSLLGGYFSIEGTGAITKAGDNDCTPLVAVNNNTGGGVDNVFVAMMNGTGQTVSEIINCVCEHGTATVGLAIEKTSNGTSIGTGLKITNATKGIETSLAAIGATGRIAKFAGAAAAPNFGDGYGAVECELTISGTVAGQTAGLSSWINVAASADCGSHKIVAQDNGIYVSATGTPMDSAIGIIGMRMQYVADGGGNPGALHLFDTNIFDNTLTSLFRVNTIADMGGSSTAATGNDYKVPLFYDQTAGQVWYVNIYHS